MKSSIIDSADFKHSNGKINNEINGYSNFGYLTALINDNDYIIAEANIPNDGFYKFVIKYALPSKAESSRVKEIDGLVLQKKAMHRIFINNECYGSVDFDIVDAFIIKELGSLKLKSGLNKIMISKQSGYLNIDSIVITKENNHALRDVSFELSNDNASEECVDLMKLFSQIHGKGILSGQHCNKASGTDFGYIKRITGRIPAIVGFDLLSYSLATETPDSGF